jgi:hypothetical protein
MTNGPDDLSQRLAAIAKQELQTILRSTGEVDAAFFYGRRLSVRWVSERARAAAAGMRRAGARLSQEIPGVRIHAVACESGRVPRPSGREPRRRSSSSSHGFRRVAHPNGGLHFLRASLVGAKSRAALRRRGDLSQPLSEK